jgi:hypothetical protein
MHECTDDPTTIDGAALFGTTQQALFAARQHCRRHTASTKACTFARTHAHTTLAGTHAHTRVRTHSTHPLGAVWGLVLGYIAVGAPAVKAGAFSRRVVAVAVPTARVRAHERPLVHTRAVPSAVAVQPPRERRTLHAAEGAEAAASRAALRERRVVGAACRRHHRERGARRGGAPGGGEAFVAVAAGQDVGVGALRLEVAAAVTILDAVPVAVALATGRERGAQPLAAAAGVAHAGSQAIRGSEEQGRN